MVLVIFFARFRAPSESRAYYTLRIICDPALDPKPRKTPKKLFRLNFKVYLNRLFQRLFLTLNLALWGPRKGPVLTLEEELKRSHLEATEEAVILPLTNTVAR